MRQIRARNDHTTFRPSDFLGRSQYEQALSKLERTIKASASDTFDGERFKEFKGIAVGIAGERGSEGLKKGRTEDALIGTIRSLLKGKGSRGTPSLDVFEQAWESYVRITQNPTAHLKNQRLAADLRYPTEWFPATRTVQRTIHLHIGPTNSGKTYHALQRLEQAESGLYAGPLRLLAHEVYSRLNAKGLNCNLVTGEERRMGRDDTRAAMTSCTVEMVPLNTDLDIAVVDEIQMVADPERGWAWTQALLGIKAKELHLCGEARVEPLIKDLARLTGDKLVIHNYERLSPLRTMHRSLKGKIENLRKGDCLVAFSRLSIHALKKEIEKKSKRRVAVVYGSLPPETRAQQAALFNDPDNDYDVLVASDAIGMGLNL